MEHFTFQMHPCYTPHPHSIPSPTCTPYSTSHTTCFIPHPYTTPHTPLLHSTTSPAYSIPLHTLCNNFYTIQYCIYFTLHIPTPPHYPLYSTSNTLPITPLFHSLSSIPYILISTSQDVVALSPSLLPQLLDFVFYSTIMVPQTMKIKRGLTSYIQFNEKY